MENKTKILLIVLGIIGLIISLYLIIDIGNHIIETMKFQKDNPNKSGLEYNCYKKCKGNYTFEYNNISNNFKIDISSYKCLCY